LDKKQKIEARKQDYIRTFTSITGESVLEDLSLFCRENESTFHADARIAANLDGRREVFLRIQQHLKLTEQELMILFG